MTAPRSGSGLGAPPGSGTAPDAEEPAAPAGPVGTAVSRPARRPRRGLRGLGDLHAYLFIAPSLFGVLAFLLLPVLIVLVLSFFDWELLSDPTFVGLDNYRRMAGDGGVWRSMLVTVGYVLLCIPLQTVLAMVLALLLNRRLAGVRFYRALYVVPWMATPIVLGLTWKWIFDPRDGVVNNILDLFGVTGPAWLSDPTWALPAIALVNIWQYAGYNMLFFLAGLQGIPRELYDAAAVDGAAPVQRFFRVTLPLLNPTMFFVLVTNLIGAFQIFDTVFVMTDGGPSHRTEVINFKIYGTAFREFDFGYASALSMLLFVVILTVTLVQVRFFAKRTTYDLS
ncbi:carbohydrate ABC transporter permease [Streptosporangium pseudovulgare]|uniref:Sugar ABC transporter, permease protein n=1 Tax=Streptosporangium pseudovulgare TaxID=35765 RepID=A0ABQ2QWA2_9ACTN|nr:sugar ABC transporter permease [Streptosporangium pseudovulgare]GGQ00892.1 putative sugar ABC transporter, permease protein [Streptosporangium pseudovulgare]